MEWLNKMKRLFIMGNGPSLNDIDINILKNEDTFSLNRAYIAYKEWDFCPTYYMILDLVLIQDILQDLNSLFSSYDISKIFLDYRCIDKWGGGIISRDNIFPIVNTGPKEGDIFFLPKNRGAISDKNDIVSIKMVPNSTYCALELAYRMGYDEVYLVGCDAKYTTEIPGTKTFGTYVEAYEDQDVNHFRPDYLGKGFKYGKIDRNGYFNVWKDTAERLNNLKDLKVISITKNSAFNEFLKYIPIEEVL